VREFNPFDVSLHGRHLVEASAGTGKTYNITSLFIRYLIEKDPDVEQILVLTYTKAAIAELKERILSRLRESIVVLKNDRSSEEDGFLNRLRERVEDREAAVKRLEHARHNFDEASIFTIHGFCQRALQEQSFLSGMPFDAELVTDDSGIVQDAVDDYWRKLVRRASDDETERVWLHILRSEKYTPDSLAGLVSSAVGKPYLELVAEAPAGSSRKEELKALTRLYRKMAEIWSAERDEIGRLLLSEAMNGNRYRRTSVPQWLDELDRWLAVGMPSLNYFDKFDRFSIGFIREFGVKKGKEAPDHPFFHTVKDFIEQADNVRSWLPQFKEELLEHVRNTTREEKLSNGVFGYDDLLVLLDRALRDPHGAERLAGYLRRKFPYALVDEFQDTDPVQYEILNRVYGSEDEETGLFLIGDPKQSIYSFRGADVFSYLRARSRITGENLYGLGHNYRSTRNLIESVNAVFGRSDTPFMVEDIGFVPAEKSDKPVKEYRVEGEMSRALAILQSESLEVDESANKSTARQRAARVTAESIARLLNQGAEHRVTIGGDPVRARDIAVLVRKHDQADLVSEALDRRGIKSVQYSQKSVFETDEARDLELFLEAVAEPGNDRAVRSALATRLFPHTASDLLAFEENEQQWADLVGMFGDWNRTWQQHGFTPMFRAFLRDAEVEQQLVSLSAGERKLTNTLQLGELLQARQKESNGGMFELIRWLAHKRKEPDDQADEEQLRLESDRELVKIVTMHRSKGLEYPVVYCPFLWDGSSFSDSGKPFLYHDPDTDYAPSLDLNEKGDHERTVHRYRAAIEEISESLRLAYVAMTRAKQHCTIVYEHPNGIEYSALGYLLLGRETIERHLKDKIMTEGSTSSMPADRFVEALHKLTEQNRSLISHDKLDDRAVTPFRGEMDDGKSDLVCRRMPEDREIVSRSVISSFSSIMHPSVEAGGNDELSDEYYLPEEFYTDTETEERSIFTFPRGPQAGSCVHKILEDLNFSGIDSGAEHMKETVGMNLEQFGLDREWTETVADMVRTVLRTNLRDGIRLVELTGNSLVKEMEFYFDLEPFRRKALVELVRGGAEQDTYFGIPEGFMKGYIDLVFEWDNRFYILDYKTNYLGDEPDDYTDSKMNREMQLSGYDVQYHIYSVALHRYLAARMQDYDYQEHFGGVFYLFVRGMGHEDPSGGIFFDRPGQSKLEQLDLLFMGQEARPV